MYVLGKYGGFRMEIITDNLNYAEVEKLVQFLKDLHQIDYNVNIESVKDSTKFKINLERF